MKVLEIQSFLSPIVDLWIFYKISNIKYNKKDLLFSVGFVFGSVLLANLIENDVGVSLLQILILCGFYLPLHKNKVILGASSVVEVIDLLFSIIVTLCIYGFGITSENYFLFLSFFIIYTGIIIFVHKYHKNIYKLLSDDNNVIFIYLMIYIYLSGEVISYFADKEKAIRLVFEVYASLLILQILFAVLAYTTTVRIQKKLMTRQEQREQKLQLELANADRKAQEAKNRELTLKQDQLKSEMQQLQEYTDYLDKNEDDLRKFKHDYQNILNSLKISAEEGNTQEVVDELTKYTNTQFNQKALRKYKGVNHIQDKNLKSIAIAKLSKLYNADINYSFACEKEIDQIPHSVDSLDLIRIIGIAFDNAVEESQLLIKETGDQSSAQVDAMYYQEDGDFEFEIRNQIRATKINADKISQKNYTTKQHHMGLGLANVQEIAHKYEESMIIDYSVEDGWFIFNLTILPDGIEE